eukprot:TRINITY_DN27751_c0_g1_i1.p1 TRINITY_DN27751_c0_g1~~TRINITY_DN27751_c0_g1_i1.p1  ORF type:complete len:967 (+),score=203.06 TRINITY_DN27751_c0_g1_i1:207-3107(+)
MLLPLYHYHPTFSSKTLKTVPSLLPSSSPKSSCSFNTPKPPKSLSRNSPSPNAGIKTVSKTAIQRIAEKLRNLGFLEETQETHHLETGSGSAGEIFIPPPDQLPVRRIGHTIDGSWSTPANPVPEPGSGIAITRYHEVKGELEKQKELAVLAEGKKRKRTVPPTVAELTVPEEELRRLRSVGIRLRKKIIVGKAGITEGIVNGIHERWRRSEVVKIKCEDLCRINMKRTHETLERKTGGLVVWRSGSIIVLYRGANYEYPYFLSDNSARDKHDVDYISTPDPSNDDEVNREVDNSLGMVGPKSLVEPISSNRLASSFISGVGSPKKVRFILPGEVQLEEEADRLLDGLGPRFTDWWGYNPLPVDADLLSGIVPGYRKPFRLLPYGIKPKLTDREMTVLRRLGRPLPCHFALGRNRNLQGLAISIVKLWEKCEIAKIAVKRGVQNTNSQVMAEELKQLTGGTLISRDREFIVLYRGKDFLPPAVSAAIEERRNNGTRIRKMRMDSGSSVEATVTPTEHLFVDELQEVKDQKKAFTSEQSKLRPKDAAVKSLDAKLSLVLEKKAEAEKLLEELDKMAEPLKPEVDKEGITEEERYMLRKVGLRMNAYLLMGRRGVFDGTIENMHLHWKYRELVKVISKDKSFEDVNRTARTLEAESGGILVAVERVSKGHAIIVYRGKNYKRPTDLRPRTLLNKRQAMNRSLEAQRRESLKLHVLKLTKNIDRMKQQLVKDDTVANHFQQAESEGAITEFETSGSGSLKSSYHEMNVKMDIGTEAQSVTEETADLSNNEFRVASSEPLGKQHDPSVHNEEMKKPAEDEMPSSIIQLSNRERLVLRKQALKMKKRPVLAVGRNNVITGVAKAINTHFRKNPLAIVNVKGRAKGTTVEEVVFELEQATGAVLVSREPNKVILYRGWGEGGPIGTSLKEKVDGTKTCRGGKSSVKEGVSPQLLAAIRLECGLQAPQEDIHL